MAKILAIDVGEKRVGLATTDSLEIIASPFGWIPREGAVAKISEIISSEEVDQILVGMPFLPSGGLGSQSKDVLAFTEELKKELNIPIDFEDEVLSSVEAEKRLKEMKKSNCEKGDVDAMAACVFLESYLRKGKYEN